MARVDFQRMAGVYDAGRDHPTAHREAWRAALAPFVHSDLPLLDLGSGTGQWSGLLADWFGVPVVAVEPSEAMREQSRSRGRPDVHVVGASAEHLPLTDCCVGTAWVSAVWHHLVQPRRVVAELRRVLVPNGTACLRGAFPDAGPLQDLAILRAFPEATAVLASFPRMAEVIGEFAAAGFRHRNAASVTEVVYASAADAYVRSKQRADTLLQHLPDDVYRRRLDDLAAAARAESAPQPAVGRVVLLVFEAD